MQLLLQSPLRPAYCGAAVRPLLVLQSACYGASLLVPAAPPAVTEHGDTATVARSLVIL